MKYGTRVLPSCPIGVFPSIVNSCAGVPVLAGKQFKLERATLAIDNIGGRRRAVTISCGTVLKVASGPNNGDGMVKVHWEDRIVEMFEVDLNVRGTEITDQSATP